MSRHRKMQPPLVFNDELVTVPLIPSAARALHDWIADRSAEIDELLSQYGVRSEEIKAPQYEVIICHPLQPTVDPGERHTP